jgi:hypothetical protein
MAASYNSEMVSTSAKEKLLASVVNALVVAVLSLPFLMLWGFGTQYRVALVILFFLYQLVVLVLPGRRSLGMRWTKAYWNRYYPILNHITYALLYSISFSTLVIWIVYPFDLLLVNLLCIQLPMVRATGYTLHGYLSGKMAGHVLTTEYE